MLKTTKTQTGGNMSNKDDIVDLVKELGISGEDLARALFNYFSRAEMEAFLEFLRDEGYEV